MEPPAQLVQSDGVHPTVRPCTSPDSGLRTWCCWVHVFVTHVHLLGGTAGSRCGRVLSFRSRSHSAVRVVHSTVVQQHFPKASLGYACH